MDFAHELVVAFTVGCEEILSEMRASAHASDVPTLARAAHKLKGAGANLHLETLTSLAYDMECRVKRYEQRNWLVDIEKIAAEIRRALEMLRAELQPVDVRKAG